MMPQGVHLAVKGVSFKLNREDASLKGPHQLPCFKVPPQCIFKNLGWVTKVGLYCGLRKSLGMVV